MITGVSIRVDDCEDLAAVEEELMDLVTVVHEAVNAYCIKHGLGHRDDGGVGYTISSGPIAEYDGGPHDRDGVRLDTGRAEGRVVLAFHD